VDTTEYLGGGKMKTGYPVMIVVVEVKIIVKQVFISPAKENEFVLWIDPALNMSVRNNEMIQWFAKYFL
jgi:hypothetical protein